MTLTARAVEIPGAPEQVNAYFVEQRWSDGLPIVPPTEERVAWLLSRTAGDPAEVLGRVPPTWGRASVEKVAINAVMAGCRPEHLPVVVAALEGMLQPSFNLYGIQTTTHPVAPLVVVNGPIARALSINGGTGAFGPGWTANATIGRAIRLVLMNLGGAWPGVGDMATHGSPAKYTYCIAENEAESPWEPLHVALGLAPGESAVTVVSAEGPHNVNDHVSTSGLAVLDLVAEAMTTPGSNPVWYQTGGKPQWLVGLGPEHAAAIAREGFSRLDVQRYLFERARVPLERLRGRGMWAMHDWPALTTAIAAASGLVPVASQPEDILVAVVGGPGKHSVVVPSGGIGRGVTRRVDRSAPAAADGPPLP